MSKIQHAAKLQAMTPQAPARLRVSLAARAHRALILRTGPGKWTQAILWHTNNDTFEYGQWFHGTIHSADLSPDGTKLVYWAVKYHLEERAKSGADPDLIYRFTAVSNPPYFTALAMWDLIELQDGRGCFLDENTLLIRYNGENDRKRLPTKGRLPNKLKIVTDLEDNIYRKCAELGGWEFIQEYLWNDNGSGQPEIWRKRGKNGKYDLLSKDFGTVRYFLVNRKTNYELELGPVSWADLDQNGRLVVARDGKVWSASVRENDIEATEIADFNDQKITEVIAPEWARHW